MKATLLAVSLLALLPGINCQLSTAFAQGIAFTYQGRLNEGGAPANGIYDFRFSIYDAANGGGALAAPLTNSVVAVTNGVFTTPLDFGAGIVFDGNGRWLEIAVRPNGAPNFTPVGPRQKLTAAPYAAMANSASNLLGTLSTAQLSGTIPVSQLSGAAGNFTATNLTVVSSITGNGGGLTNLNAASLTGTIADARLSANVVLLNASQTFSGQNTFQNIVQMQANVGIGKANPAAALDANGTVAASNFVGSGAGLTNLSLPAGSIGPAQLSTNVQFAWAPYLSAVTSSAPQEVTLRISIDDVVTQPPATLAAPYTERYEIATSGGLFPTNMVGAPVTTGRQLVLRRKVSDDTTWLNYRLSDWYTNQTPVEHLVVLELMQGTTIAVSWKFSGAVVYQHNYRLAADGLPVEEIGFVFPSSVVRRLNVTGGALPAGPGPQVGFASGWSARTPYSVMMKEGDWRGTSVIASDLSEASSFQWDSQTGRPVLSATRASPLILRQSPLAGNDLWSWYSSQASPPATRRTIEVHFGKLLLQTCYRAFPYSYTLALGDDGLPYEEYSINYRLIP